MNFRALLCAVKLLSERIQQHTLWNAPLCYPAVRFFTAIVAIPLFNAVLLDIAVWIVCLTALLAFARLSATHPATPYLIFHGWFFTGRSLAILNGAPTLFSWHGGDPLTPNEIARAVLLADAALIAMTGAWVLASRRNASGEPQFQFEPMPLRRDLVSLVAAFAIPLGTIAMLLWSRVPGLEAPGFAARWAGSNWAVVSESWVGLALLALIYSYGLKMVLVAPFAAYLVLAAYQGNFRFRLLIPAILLVQIYVDQQGKRWPSIKACIALLGCAVLFFPLKEIGQSLQSGGEPAAIWQGVERQIMDVFHGTHPDEMILDELASTLTLADQRGKLLWGRTYSGILTVAVPRQWWPEKPGLADFEKEISTAGRPMATDGMVVTMLGELYVNFWYPGVILLSFATAYLLGRAFDAAYRRGYFTLARFTYLLVACNLIQVFRDGLISLFVFLAINMMPLMAIMILHFFYPSRVVRSSPLLQTPRVRTRGTEQTAS